MLNLLLRLVNSWGTFANCSKTRRDDSVIVAADTVLAVVEDAEEESHDRTARHLPVQRVSGKDRPPAFELPIAAFLKTSAQDRFHKHHIQRCKNLGATGGSPASADS